MNRASAKAAREAFKKAMAQVGKDIGYQVKVGGRSTYDDGFVEFKVTLVEEGGATPEQAAYDARVSAFDLPEREAGVLLDGRKFTIHGWRPRSRTNQIIVKGIDGKNYRASIQAVQRGYERWVNNG